jgi:hypothetical protein
LRAERLFRHLVDCGKLDGWNRNRNGRTHTMAYALRLHCQDDHVCEAFLRGIPMAVINVQICWDADRLCRYRLGERPSNAYLNTRQAKTHAAREIAAAACAERSKRLWSAILASTSLA